MARVASSVLYGPAFFQVDPSLLEREKTTERSQKEVVFLLIQIRGVMGRGIRGVRLANQLRHSVKWIYANRNGKCRRWPRTGTIRDNMKCRRILLFLGSVRVVTWLGYVKLAMYYRDFDKTVTMLTHQCWEHLERVNLCVCHFPFLGAGFQRYVFLNKQYET